MNTYKFRLYPTKETEGKMQWTLNKCRFVYNEMLETLGEGARKADVQRYIIVLKEEHPELKEALSLVLQCQCRRLYRNLSNLRKAKLQGRKVGRLKFKGYHHFNTFEYYNGFKFTPVNKKYGELQLNRIGKIKIRTHREVIGKISYVSINKEVDKWYANLTTK